MGSVHIFILNVQSAGAVHCGSKAFSFEYTRETCLRRFSEPVGIFGKNGFNDAEALRIFFFVACHG
jgi:hypothetical protein